MACQIAHQKPDPAFFDEPSLTIFVSYPARKTVLHKGLFEFKYASKLTSGINERSLVERQRVEDNTLHVKIYTVYNIQYEICCRSSKED